MCVEIPEVRVGEPQVCGGVSAFPLFAEQPSSLDYLLSDEAIAAGTLAVTEVSEAGEVPCLLVDNGGDRPVLFVEGEEVRGGKQDRVLCNSVLAAGVSRTRIPVACVEPGRWDCESPAFASGSCCPPSLRHVLQVGGNARQARVWATIHERHRRLGVRSPTGNMSDALGVLREAAEELRRGLPYAEGASGIAVALGGKVVGIDLFDKPATMAKTWDRLVQGLVLDAAATPDAARRASGSDVAVKLYMVKNMRWQRLDPVFGSGEAYQGRSEDGVLATALVAGGGLVHLGVSMST
jgi:hypothetical protein